MLSPTRLFLAAAVSASCLGASAAAAQAAPLALVIPVTDNYKAQYNADPSAPESRTWLSISAIAVGGRSFQVTSLPADHAFTAAATGLDLSAADGTTAHLTAATTSPNAAGQGSFRIDADGRFGILITVKDRAELPASPVLETLTLASGGQIVGTSTVVYAYDADVADAPAGSIEFNGPGGRWLVDGIGTPLDWQVSATPSGPPSSAPPMSGAPSSAPPNCAGATAPAPAPAPATQPSTQPSTPAATQPASARAAPASGPATRHHTRHPRHRHRRAHPRHRRHRRERARQATPPTGRRAGHG